ncbi:molecular chaperone DnaJ [Methylobacterium radiotolerans]|nr:molecular chaperone DnaJ [Methylobacterium radiotolerans]
MTQAYPLQWPIGRPRKRPEARKVAAFGKMDRGWKETLTVGDARGRLQSEVDLLRAQSVVLSSNVELRLDGQIRSGQREPVDPGVALYFSLGGKPHVLACDTYRRVADNIAALAAHIKATRKIERYGVATAAEMFAGFRALPAPGATPWWQVLGVQPGAGAEEIEAAFRKLARERHPDRPGGSHDLMADLNRARDAGLKAKGGCSA